MRKANGLRKTHPAKPEEETVNEKREMPALDEATIERLKTCNLHSWSRALTALQAHPLGSMALDVMLRRIKDEDVARAFFAVIDNFNVIVPVYAIRHFWKKNGRPVSDEDWGEARRYLSREDLSPAYEELTDALRNEFGFNDD